MIGRFSQHGAYRQLLQSREFLRTSFAGVLALASFLWDHGNSGSASVVGNIFALLSVGINGLPIIWGAIKGVVERRVNVDELVSLAIVASLIKGEFLSAAVVSFVMVVGSLIEQSTSDSARRAIETLINLSPQMATVLIGGEPVEKAVSEVKPGDLLLVRPGDRIPADATIANGSSAVDESSMTGEPIPKDKTIGESVYAGILNLNGVLEVKATRVGKDSTLGKIVQLVSEAETHKPKAVRLIDRYARLFTPTILICSGMAWWVTGDVDRGVTVLIVGCPCALILAAPTAIVATLSRAAKAGILVKGGRYLEVVAGADAVLFDKTGTITQGKPRVQEIIAVDGRSSKEILRLAACVEQNSTHPLARAVLNAAHCARIVVGEAQETCMLIGAGVRGLVQEKWIEVGSACIASSDIPASFDAPVERIKEKGATPLFVYEDCKAVGVISVSDTIRPEAKETVKSLCSMGIKNVGLLSGDHVKSACMVADAVGLTDTWAEMKPEDKLRKINELQAKGRRVIFVGDGINDAPALAAADVGIAMGAAGTDVALETADIALMNDDVNNVPFLVKLSRRMLSIIKINLMFGLVFNAAAVLAGGTGYLSPVMGALVHNIGSVLVVLSSASLAFYSGGNMRASFKHS